MSGILTEGLDACPRCKQGLTGLGADGREELPLCAVRLHDEEHEVICEDCLNALIREHEMDRCETCKRWASAEYLFTCSRCGQVTCDECSDVHEYE